MRATVQFYFVADTFDWLFFAEDIFLAFTYLNNVSAIFPHKFHKISLNICAIEPDLIVGLSVYLLD